MNEEIPTKMPGAVSSDQESNSEKEQAIWENENTTILIPLKKDAKVEESSMGPRNTASSTDSTISQADQSNEGSMATGDYVDIGEVDGNKFTGIPSELRLRRKHNDDDDQSNDSMPSLVSWLGNSFRSQSSNTSTARSVAASSSSVFDGARSVAASSSSVFDGSEEYSSIPSINTIKTFQTTESEIKTVKTKNYVPGVVTPKKEKRWEMSASPRIENVVSAVPPRARRGDDEIPAQVARQKD
jgi:hypothetical protein